MYKSFMFILYLQVSEDSIFLYANIVGGSWVVDWLVKSVVSNTIVHRKCQIETQGTTINVGGVTIAFI